MLICRWNMFPLSVLSSSDENIVSVLSNQLSLIFFYFVSRFYYLIFTIAFYGSKLSKSFCKIYLFLLVFAASHNLGYFMYSINRLLVSLPEH